MNYQVKITLLTETLLGSGNAIPGYVDADVQTDEYGLPFLKAKTLKGLLREHAQLIACNLDVEETLVESLFGTEMTAGKIRFSDGTFSQTVQKAFHSLMSEEQYTKEDMIQALTSEYSFTRLEHGVAVDHSLRTIRMLNQNMDFYAELEVKEELSQQEESLLGCAVGMLKHVGTLKSKGKGYVTCQLLNESHQDITATCMQRMTERSACNE